LLAATLPDKGLPLVRGRKMLDAAAKALAQMVSPPFRAVLVKSVALALVLLAVLGVAVDRVVMAFLARGLAWLEASAGTAVATPIHIMEWLVALATGLGVIATAVFLIPAVTAIVASLFVDQIAETVERAYYPADPVGTALPMARAIIEGGKAALLTVVVYVCTVPLLFIAGAGFFIFFVAMAYVQGRIYFELAAMRFRTPTQAKRLRSGHQATVFMGGLLIAGFLSIPIVSLATPLFAIALMVHVHKRLTRGTQLLVAHR
jgi:CysZ protein